MFQSISQSALAHGLVWPTAKVQLLKNGIKFPVKILLMYAHFGTLITLRLQLLTSHVPT